MNRTYPLIAAAVLALASLACGVTLNLPDDAVETGPTVVEQISIPDPNPGGSTQLTINFGAGDLNLQPGAAGGLLTGTASYNVTDLKPEYTTSGDSLTLEQGTFSYDIGGLPNFGAIENTWDLYLANSPVELELRAGAFKGQFELGGLALEDLEIFTGAADLEINFSSPNLASMGSFRLTTGASNTDLLGLGNANFSLLEFRSGAGDYTLDFSGQLQRDATVKIDAALSNIVIIVPEGVPALVEIEGGLNNITAEGTWSGSENNYNQSGGGPTLTIQIDIGAGNLVLKNE